MKNCTILMSDLDFIQVAKILMLENLKFRPKNHQFIVVPYFLKTDVKSEPLEQFL